MDQRSRDQKRPRRRVSDPKKIMELIREEGVSPLHALSLILDGIGALAKRLSPKLLEQDALVDPKFLKQFEDLKDLADALYAGGHFDSVRNFALDTRERLLLDLPLVVRYFCDENGFRLDGGFPDHIINGIVYVGFDTKKGRVSVNDEVVPLFPVEDVLSCIRREVDSSKKKAAEPTQFIQMLWTAYRNTLDKQRLDKERLDHPTTRAPIFAVMIEFALLMQGKRFLRNPIQKHFASYSQHQLRADLFTLLAVGGPLTINDQSLILEPTSVADEGLYMYLPDIGRCAYVGYVVFAPVA